MSSVHIQHNVYDSLEWHSLLKLLDALTLSQPGKNLVTTIEPLSIDAAREQLLRISELKNGMIEGSSPEVAGLVSCAVAAKRAAKGSALSMSEILAARSTVLCSTRIVSFFSSHASTMPVSQRRASQLPDITELASLLRRSFTEDGNINGDEYPQIYRIEKAIFTVRSEIESRLSKMMHSNSLETVLQEKVFSTRNDRYVLLVKANMKGKLKGTVHDVSASSATLFVEPEAVSHLCDELMMRKAELVRETERILAELSETVGSNAEEITLHEAFAAVTDMLCAAARLSRDLRCGEPVLADEPMLELFSARHPILQSMIGSETIPNDIILGKDRRSILITGANTGGKTVLLKTAGLCTIMAMHGLHIPASPDSRVGFFSSIMTDIGDDQSIEKSLSTFSGQIIALNGMTRTAGKGTLVLLDEIMAGTNPRYGAALAQSFLETLVSRGALVIATTHYPELRNLPASDSRFTNASVSFNVDTLRPSYELSMGIPGSSYTFEIARRYETSEEIISHAESLLSSTELSVDALLEKINRTASDLAIERSVVDKLREELSFEKDRYSVLSKRLTDETARLRKNQTSDLLDEIHQMRTRASQKISELQSASLSRASEISSELAAMEKSLRGRLHTMTQSEASGKYLPFDTEQCKEGDTVFVISLEKEGTLISLDIHKQLAQIRLGLMTSRYGFDDLLLAQKKPEPPAARQMVQHHVSPSKGMIPTTLQTRYNTIDLRGLRVDEALIKLGNDLDGMMRGGISSVVIIHGHGTGAMKEAVRTALKTSPYVESFRRGEQQGEGGDGVTIALLSL